MTTTNVDLTHGAYTSASKTTAVKVIEVKPVRGLWKVFGVPGVEPVFGGQDGRARAISYAGTRQGFGRGEVRVLDTSGEVIKTIQFDDRAKRL